MILQIFVFYFDGFLRLLVYLQKKIYAYFSKKYFLPVYKYFCVQHWLEPGKRVSQQIKGISPVTLYLGVKFYAADPCKLAEEVTRYIPYTISTHTISTISTLIISTHIYNIYTLYTISKYYL